MMTETLVWGTSIAWYLFLAGLSAGAFATAALISFTNSDTLRIQRIGRLLAPVVLGVGLLLLMLDAEAGMKNPVRFFLLVSNLDSVMSWGVIILAVFGVITVVSAVLSLLKRNVPRLLDSAGLVMAFCTAAYTGVLLGVVKTYPIWNTSLLPLLFVVSAFSAGMAATFLGAFFSAKAELEKIESLKRLHLVLPVVEAVLLIFLLMVTASSNPAAAESVSRLVGGDLALVFWLGLVVTGLLVPLTLEVVVKRIKLGSNASAALDITGNAGTLVGGFLLRYLVIFAAVPLVFVV